MRSAMAPNRLRVRAPALQLGYGEEVVQDSPYNDAEPQGVLQQNDAPQQVQSVATPTATTVPFVTQTAYETTPTVVSTVSGNRERTGFYFTSTTLGSTLSSELASLAMTSDTVISSIIPSSSLVTLSVPSSIAFSSAATASLLVASSVSAPSISSSATSSQSSPPASSSPTASSSVSPSSTSAVAGNDRQTMAHGAPFYASLALGVIILFACVVAVITFCIRIRARRRDRLTAVEWEPVVLPDPKPSIVSDLSLIGDRDVGEPKRTNSFVDRLAPFPWESVPPYQHQDSYTESAYYTPHELPPLADSTAYPLPPRVSLANAPHTGGPYPTARPLPAYLPNGDPQRIPGFGRSRASSRTGSVRSHLPSAATLCVTNGASSAASSRACTPAPAPHHLRDYANFSYQGAAAAPAQRHSVPELGTPREVDVRPRFMTLPGGRGLDVPWDDGSARQPQGQGRGQGQIEGWTQALRSSVLGALHAVTGGGVNGILLPDEAEEDHLTRAPSMVARARRESGWRRFAAQDGDLEREPSRSSMGAVRYSVPGSSRMEPPAFSLSFQPSCTSLASDMHSVRTDNSRVPLIARPRPALVARASSVYSTVSAVPPLSGYSYRPRAG
ncbi:hypothetical protein GGX14DRAFT_694217 [Mycena pura]|uniref:Transmembrane protein n=1 Tax=Mycena pura TaxID=153505 RepID=A0AAD6YNP7_9AGAR|nr:hypothetical protein GGX14DRAFT_694217 [Mycena pura]